jgi:flagellar protein FlaI
MRFPGLKIGLLGGRGRGGRGGGKRGEEEEGGGVSAVKVWRGVPEGRVVKQYRVGLTNIYIVESGAFHKYIVADPEVDGRALKKLGEALERLVQSVDPGLFLDAGRREEALKVLRSGLGKLGVRDEVLLYFAERELLGFGPLDPVLRDRQLENVECKGPGKPLNVVHVEFGRIESNMVFSEPELDSLVQRLVFKAGKSCSAASPKVDNALLPGVGRLTATCGREISGGSSFVVRIFPERPWTVLGLLERNTLSPEVAAYLWLAVEYKMPILIAGEMGSGKTSYANAILGLAPPDRRIGTAEDVPEFNIPHLNWQKYLTDERRGIDLFELVKLLLRANVDYVVINEIRGAEESRAWFQAISTGHGGVTTIHADTVESVFNRLDNLGIPPEYLTSLALVVFIGRFKIGGRIQRRTQYVFDIIDPKARQYAPIFTYRAETDGYETQDLASARTTKRILELAKWDVRRFVEEYERRVEFLRRLLCLHRNSPINDVRVLAEHFARFYQGYMPKVPPVCEKPGGKKDDVKPPPPKADWVVNFRMPAGPKRVRLRAVAAPGSRLEIVEVSGRSVGGGEAEVEVSEPSVSVAVVGFGRLFYEVEMGGWVVGRGVVDLVRRKPPQPPEEADLGETKVLEEGEKTKIVEETMVLEDGPPLQPAPRLCLRVNERSLPLVAGRVYGREDFEFVGEGARFISKNHFRVEERGGGLWIVDLGSKNGTFVNNVRAERGAGIPLFPGSVVRVGKVEGTVEVC